MPCKNNLMWKDVLTEHIRSNGGRVTPARLQIAEVFFSMDGHPRIEILSAEVKRRFPGIGDATVYRTMKLLCEAKLAEAHHFGEGFSRFEAATFEADEGLTGHHDHLICVACGKIIEFEDPGIERLQDRAATRHGFKIASHRLEIFGTCEACREV